MTLQTSGAISMFNLNTELGLSSSAQINMLGSAVRGLSAVPSGAVSLFNCYGKSNATYVGGTLTGSGYLSIPAGVTLVTLEGHGGYGGNNYDPGQAYIPYDPGQPEILPYWDNPGHPASPATYKWSDTGYGTSYWTDENSVDAMYNILHVAVPTGSCSSTDGKLVATGPPTWEPNWTGTPVPNIPPHWYFTYTYYYAVVDQPAVAYEAPSGTYHPGQPYIAPTPEQPYIAPSGGDYYGTATTASLNGTTRSWGTGLGTSALGATSVQTLTSTGAGQTLSYAISGAGELSYFYYV